MANTHYQTLGVTPESTPEEIRSAYRKLVLKHHPDQSKDPRSKAILVAAVEAYEVLSDRHRKLAYDKSIAFERERAKTRQREAEAAADNQKTTPPQDNVHRRAERVHSKQAVTEDLLRLAKLYKVGRFDDAEQLANDILGRTRKEALTYSVLGNIARARGQFDIALGRYAEALQCDPHHPVYQRQYEELLDAMPTDITTERSSAMGAGASMLGVGAAVCSCVYIVLSHEAPIAAGISLVSTWTLGLVVMLFLCGVCVGVALCLAGKLDRFNAVTNSGQGKVSPAMALGAIAVVNFWIAAALYVILGSSQNSFNFSTSRLVAAVGAVVLLAALSAHFSFAINGLQVLAWGGNLTYIGSVCGWMVSDSIRS